MGAPSVKSDEVLLEKGVGKRNVTDQRLARSCETLPGRDSPAQSKTHVTTLCICP
jgi:hypothetical protein